MEEIVDHVQKVRIEVRVQNVAQDQKVIIEDRDRRVKTADHVQKEDRAQTEGLVQTEDRVLKE
jgi:hypothetical protein